MRRQQGDRAAGRQPYHRTAHRWTRTATLLPLLAFLPLLPLHAQAPSPSETLGIVVGADSVLANWTQIDRYMSTLALASDRVRLDTIGRTTLGKPLLMVTLTSPDNHRHLAEIKANQALLADPRRLSSALEDSLASTMPAVVFINNNIHSTEIGSSQFSMILAHRLATDERYQAWLDNLVVLMTPSANPDGLDTVVAWYREFKGTPFEGGPLPWLYHPYVGHDNNRDWFMLTQVESQATSRVLYREWFPEVVWDVHQMGNRGARLFVPPFSDPVNPNLDPIVVEATNLVGTAMAAAVYDAGKTGVAHQTRFDLWWHGGFRTVPARHNMIGILSEAASARLASPIDQDSSQFTSERGSNYPAPWRGGRWSMGDIIEYELLAAEGLLRLVATQREQFIRRFVLLGRRAVAAGEVGHPYAYVIPSQQHDRGTTALMVNTLMASGIEVYRATEPFAAGGDRYPAGTMIIPMAQPFRAHVKDLLEIQRYPDRRTYPGGPPQRPYDVAGWSLALQMGVDVVEIGAPFTAPMARIEEATVAAGNIHGAGEQWVLANGATMESRTIVEALQAGARVWVSPTPLTLEGTSLPAGVVVLEHDRPEILARVIRGHVQQFGFDAWRAQGLTMPAHSIARLPRIGLYKPWTASMDEGWTRWVLEQHGIPYVSVTDAMVRAGNLRRDFDVLLLPDLTQRSIVAGRAAGTVPDRYAGGIGDTGAQQIVDFVQDGGVLVALDGSSEFAMRHLDLPVRNALRGGERVEPNERFVAPGSLFEVAIAQGNALTSGMRAGAHVYFANSVAFVADTTVHVLARYLPQPLRSGYALNADQLGGKAALVDVRVARGRAILFGFRPQHRGQPHGTFKLLFNALLLSGLD